MSSGVPLGGSCCCAVSVTTVSAPAWGPARQCPHRLVVGVRGVPAALLLLGQTLHPPGQTSQPLDQTPQPPETEPSTPGSALPSLDQPLDPWISPSTPGTAPHPITLHSPSPACAPFFTHGVKVVLPVPTLCIHICSRRRQSDLKPPKKKKAPGPGDFTPQGWGCLVGVFPGSCCKRLSFSSSIEWRGGSGQLNAGEVQKRFFGAVCSPMLLWRVVISFVRHI